MAKIEEYETEKLKKEIKTTGWILSILGIAIIYFGITIVYDVIQEIDLKRSLLAAYVAMVAGSGVAFIKRRKKVNELRNRES